MSDRLNMRIGCVVEQHEKEGACYNCCDQCNYDTHRCPCCGDDTYHDGRSTSDGKWHLYDVHAENVVIKDGKVVAFQNELDEHGNRRR